MVLPFYHKNEEADGEATATGSWLTDPIDWWDDQLTWQAILQEENYKYKMERKREKEANSFIGF